MPLTAPARLSFCLIIVLAMGACGGGKSNGSKHPQTGGATPTPAQSAEPGTTPSTKTGPALEQRVRRIKGSSIGEFGKNADVADGDTVVLYTRVTNPTQIVGKSVKVHI